MIGRVLGGRYTIQERIGGGGMSLVYRAFDSVLNRPVAVKVLRAEFVNEADLVRRFRQEAQAAASLQHPNIVNIFDVGEQDADTYFIVMEYVPGHTLKDELRLHGPQPPERAAALCAEILAALEEAHAHGIVHRDVKPQNILLIRSGHAKVSDFGIARAAASATIVHTSRALGTAHYASPEQVRGAPTDERSDVYSVGCVLYEALTGQPPFVGDDALSVMWQHTQTAPPDPRSLRPDVPAALAAVTNRALAKRPEDRYPSATAMLADLQRAAGMPRTAHGVQLGPSVSGSGPGGPGAASPASGTGSGGPGGSGTPAGGRRGDRSGARAAGRRGRDAARGGAATAQDTVVTAPAFGEPARGRPGPAAGDGAGRSDTPSPAAAAMDGTLDLKALGDARRRNGSLRQAGAPPAAVAGGAPRAAVGAAIPAGRATPARAAVPHATVRRWRAPRWMAAVLVIALVVAAGVYLLNQAMQVPTVRVPDIVGRSQPQAVSMLAAAGLQANVSATIPNAAVAPGDVISASPAPGSAVKRGRTVQLTISTGPAVIAGGVPDVTGLDSAAATAMLRSVGLVPTTSPQFSATVAQGQVIASDPSAGAPARQGDAVTIQVSEGPAPQPVKMPNLIGKLLADAEAGLKTLDLQTGTITQTKSGYPAGYVVGTQPAASAGLSPGQSVNLTVSSGCQGSATLHLTVPASAVPPVQVVVVITDQMPTPHPVFQQPADPGATITVNACWLGAAARWTAYANGNVFSTGTLNASGAH